MMRSICRSMEDSPRRRRDAERRREPRFCSALPGCRYFNTSGIRKGFPAEFRIPEIRMKCNSDFGYSEFGICLGFRGFGHSGIRISSADRVAAKLSTRSPSARELQLFDYRAVRTGETPVIR